MMRDGGNDAQELNISRHPNMKDAPGRGGLQIDPLRTMPPGPPRVTNLLLFLLRPFTFLLLDASRALILVYIFVSKKFAFMFTENSVVCV